MRQHRDKQLLSGLSESVLAAIPVGTRPDGTGRPIPLAEAGIYQVGAIRDHELLLSFTKANFPHVCTWGLAPTSLER